ncbi:Os03g0158600 [Oryza sativa Japonica Group]|jgi:ribonuclease HI|nr:expressed protein [Oryza sativa Japonica Group]KAB8090284.1 hypothetical protein EE612_015426 [Oryza sativa]BAS82391.1 Os03g0158600 [Oryza sativa Japonica Group]
MPRVYRPDLGVLRPCNPILACGLVAGEVGRWTSSSSSERTTWRKPEVGWMKLNFDGSRNDATGAASIGGAFRDHEGAFVAGYAERMIVGGASSFTAELAALRRGLELAARYGWRRVWAEGDSRAVVDVVHGRAGVRSEEDRRQCGEIAALLPALDGVAVSHLCRDENKVAHGFAKLGHKARRRRVWHVVPPNEVLVFLQRDADRG